MFLKFLMGSALALSLSTMALADGHRTMSPDGAMVYFISPTDGAKVSNPVKVQFGLSGMGVAPAGTEKKNTGHHHLLIDTDLANYDEPVPSDDKHRHFGGGQTETSVTLSPGKHTLQLVVGDHNHVPHDPAIESKKITIYVNY